MAASNSLTWQANSGAPFPHPLFFPWVLTSCETFQPPWDFASFRQRQLLLLVASTLHPPFLWLLWLASECLVCKQSLLLAPFAVLGLRVKWERNSKSQQGWHQQEPNYRMLQFRYQTNCEEKTRKKQNEKLWRCTNPAWGSSWRLSRTNTL